MDMVVILRPGVGEAERLAVVGRIGDLGLTAHVSHGAYRTVISAIGGADPSVRDQLQQLDGVDQVLTVTMPYRLSSREFQEANTILTVGGVRIGGPHVNVIAGPCAIESREMLFEIGAWVKRCGAAILRGGAFKPRTSPYAFQGLGREGLRWLQEAGRELEMPTITEVMDPREVEAVWRHADILQIGARNMQNYNLLLEVGKTDKPVFIKRGPANTITELLMAAEYVLSAGNHQVMLCERGIRTFGDDARFTLDVSAVPVIQERSHLPVFVDPSHAAGRRDLVPALSLAAIAAGASGVMIEVHNHPDRALCDGPQALIPSTFESLMDQIRSVAEIVGHRLWNPTNPAAGG